MLWACWKAGEPFCYQVSIVGDPLGASCPAGGRGVCEEEQTPNFPEPSAAAGRTDAPRLVF